VVDDHGNLITWAVRRLNVPLDQREDARQGGALGLLNALHRFDPQKGSYRGFAASHVLEEVRVAAGMTRKRQLRTTDLDAVSDSMRIASIDDPLEAIARCDAHAAARRFLDELVGDDAYVARRVYAEGATQTEVAAELGTYKMAVSRRLAAIEERAATQLACYADAA
jgi:RNA polymerase sigma factor (sigma-70 family)